MDIKEIQLIVDNIPTILQYFIPGYWAIFLFKYFCSKQISTHMMSIMSCVLSYILIVMATLVNSCFQINTSNPVIVNSAIAVVIGTLLSIIISVIFSRQWFKKVLVFLFCKTPNDNIWRDILDLTNGSNLKIYLKEKDYYIMGHHKDHDEHDKDPWIAVSAFEKRDKKTNEIYGDEPSYLDNDSVICAVRFSDIEHIEIFN